MPEDEATMRAVVYDAVGATPRVTEVARPVCPAAGAVIEVRATGVCRSDWHAWCGHDPVPLPHTPGHEFAGEVVEVGPQVTGFAVGERVTAPFVQGCGRCEVCAAGAAQVCPDQTQPGFTHPGSFAERVVVRAADTNLVRLPASVGYAEAAVLGCRFATAFRALTGPGALEAGQDVMIIGCGGVGLSAVMIATALGGRVVAVDPSAEARRAAREAGAVRTLTPGAEAEAIGEPTGSGVHLALDAVGSAATAALGVRSLRRQGRHVQVGLMLGDAASAPLPWDLVIARELTVHGSHGMAARDYPAMLELIEQGRLDPVRLIGRWVGLDDLPAALTAMDSPAGPVAGVTVAVREPQP